MASQASAVLPDSVEWHLHRPGTDETRTFVQTELSIDGEARLLLVLRGAAVALRASGTGWEAITRFVEQDQLDWDGVLGLAGIAAETGPDILTDLACVFLGIFPVDEDGQPIESYEDNRRYIRRSLKIAIFADMVEVFASQNDWRRLLRPFSRTLGAVLGAPAVEGSQPPSDEPDEALSNVSSRLEPLTSSTSTSASGETQPRSSATSSGPSSNSSAQASDTPDNSGAG